MFMGTVEYGNNDQYELPSSFTSKSRYRKCNKFLVWLIILVYVSKKAFVKNGTLGKS